MNVYLIEISTKMYGFTIKAIVGPETEDELHKYCEEQLGLQRTDNYRHNHYRIVDSCPVMMNKVTTAEFDFEE